MKLEPHRSEEAIVKVVGPAFFTFLFRNAQIFFFFFDGKRINLDLLNKPKNTIKPS